ncbi:unnamed protein product [Caenorhabditis angaria]|uniref:Uncharacterized protein n=1 Tax=Caenorhabditis angaria TaxID=860376 RepID=A0A9P1IL66_9PELO|nr:unnamed protein product [Caenorhabditis angaria]
MEAYLLNNYTKCPPTTLLESNEFQVIIFRTLSIITFPSFVYGVYLILYVTPESMKNVKNTLMFVHICTFIFDAIVNCLVQPYFLLPTTALYLNGILWVYLGLPFHFICWIAQYSMYCLGMSIIYLFQSRHSMIITVKYRMTKTSTKIIYYTVGYFVGAIGMASYHFQDFDDEEVKLQFLQTVYPCPPIEYFDKNTFVVTNNMMVIVVGQCIVIFYAFAHAIFWIFSSVYQLTKKTAKISKHTREMQLKFLKAVSIQISVPLLAIMCPGTGMTIMIAASQKSQLMNNIIISACGLHGLMSNLCLIFVQRAYRDFTFRCFNRNRMFSKVSIVIIHTDVL